MGELEANREVIFAKWMASGEGMMWRDAGSGGLKVWDHFMLKRIDILLLHISS